MKSRTPSDRDDTHRERSQGFGASRRPAALLILGLATALVSAACTTDVGAGAGSVGSGAPPSSPIGPGAPTTSSTRIEQPPLGKWEAITRGKLAPASDRVDLEMPTFSNPTNVTNPLFPISDLHSVLALGRVDGERLRVETTLLPETKTIEWNGLQVEALQAQFLAYHDGRIEEVAVDLYAQSDDGAVWYFGEDVFVYKDGRVVATLGTWRADLDGPASMIMPANPQVGDAYRTENVPRLEFFEESIVKSIGKMVVGPTGSVEGAMIGQELHFPGSVEDKIFAPGYGEFFSGQGDNVEAMALAVPTDALSGSPPAELETLSAGALDVFELVRSKDWTSASTTLDAMKIAWDALQAVDVPPLLDAQMSRAIEQLGRVVNARNGRAAPHVALDVATASLDLQLRYRPPAEIDLARFDLWTSRLLLDAAANDMAAVLGDVTTLEWIRDRIPLDRADRSGIDDQLRFIRAAAEAEEFHVVAEDAARLRGTLSGV